MKKTAIEKLNVLESQDFAEDAKLILKDWRDSLNRIEVELAYSKLTITKEIIKAGKSRLASVDQKLLSERKLSLEDREYLLGVKDTLSTLIYWFDPKDYDQRKKSIEAEIDRNL